MAKHVGVSLGAVSVKILCKSTALTWILSTCSYKVSPSDLTDLHVIRYELERDLMPLILANTQYSIEKGKETLHEFDLPKIQQQIMARFFLGKPLITLNVSICSLSILLIDFTFDSV